MVETTLAVCLFLKCLSALEQAITTSNIFILVEILVCVYFIFMAAKNKIHFVDTFLYYHCTYVHLIYCGKYIKTFH